MRQDTNDQIIVLTSWNFWIFWSLYQGIIQQRLESDTQEVMRRKEQNRSWQLLTCIHNANLGDNSSNKLNLEIFAVPPELHFHLCAFSSFD
jgi:hypothetical protein